MRPLLGPHRARREHQGRHARVDGRAPRALRPAQRDAAGRHLELRDVRVRPAQPHLRPRQDPRRPHGALGQGGRTAQAAQRHDDHRRRKGRRDRRRPRGRIARRHHGWRRHLGDRRHAQHLRRGRVLVARGRARPFAPLQLLDRRRPPLRARRRPEPHRADHRAHHATGRRDLRRRSRQDGRPDFAPARSRARHAARGPCRARHRHAADAGAMRRRTPPPRFRNHRRRRHADRHAAAAPLRPADRGRPHRRSGTPDRLQQPADHRAARAHHRPRAARGAAQPLRGAPQRCSAGLPGNHQLQLCRSALGAGPGGQRQPGQAAEPHRQPDERDALVAARLAAAGAQVQPRPQGTARARVRAGPRVPARRQRRHHRQHRARREPAHARGRPGLGRCRGIALGRQAAACRFLRRQG
ncbi:hypothetical protein FQZ97_733250 [compost metagenome]